MKIVRSGARRFTQWDVVADAAPDMNWAKRAASFDLTLRNIAGASSGTSFNYKVELSAQELAELVANAVSGSTPKEREALASAFAPRTREVLQLLLLAGGLGRSEA